MDLVKAIIDVRPTPEEMKKFSLDLSKLIGTSNAAETAYKGVILQRYVDSMKKIHPFIKMLFELAETDINSKEFVTSADSEEMEKMYSEIEKSLRQDIEPTVTETIDEKIVKRERQEKEQILSGLLNTLRYTNSGVLDLVLVNDETVEIRYSAGGCRRVDIACDSGTAMIRDIMKHI